MCLVSIIIPCYKQAHYLSRSLASIATQDYHDIEVIIVDDGSPEPVKIPDDKWAFPIKLIRKENGGLSSARNTGTEHAGGRYIKFLDADDTLLPGCISSQVSCMGGREDIISVIGYIIEDEDTHQRQTILPAFGDIREALLQINIGPPHCYLFSANTVRQVNGFSTSDKVKGGHEDYDFVLRASLITAHCVTIHKPGVIYYKRVGSMSALFEPMARTRIAVWSDNLLRIIRGTSNDTIILAAVSGWIRLVENTPAHLSKPLDQIADILHSEITTLRREIPDEESRHLLEKLAKLNSKSSTLLYSALRNAKQSRNDSLIHPQELIDRRIGISLTSCINSKSDWLLGAVYAIHSSNKKFAVYGAGELGNSLATILQNTNKLPVVFFDRNATPNQSLHNVPVINIERSKDFQFEAIIIASNRYISDIKRAIKHYLPNVEIIEPQLPT